MADEYKIKVTADGAPAAAEALQSVGEAGTDAAKNITAASEAAEGLDIAPDTEAVKQTNDAVEELATETTAAAEAMDDLVTATETATEAATELEVKPDASAVEKTTDAVEDLTKETKKAKAEGKDVKIKADDTAVKMATASLGALEERLAHLRADLRNEAIGTERFKALSEQVAVVTGKIKETENQLSKLGTKRGNAGGAVLELSRAFEDSQYGIAGVLNNIPGLITMLGGTAGLAGVISIVAVAGSILWKKFGDGADSAKEKAKDVTDELDLIKKAADILKDLDKDTSKKLGEDASKQAKEVERALGSIDLHSTLETRKANLATAHEMLVNQINLARNGYDLAKLTSGVTKDGLTDAISLEKERNRLQKERLGLEKEGAEINRAAALSAARRKYDDSSKNSEVYSKQADEAQVILLQLKGQQKAYDDEAQKLLEDRSALFRLVWSQLAEVRDEIDKLNKTSAFFDPNRALKLDYYTNRAKNLEAYQKNLALLPPEERDLRAKSAVMDDRIKEASDRLNESTKGLETSSKALLDATLTLSNLKQTQANERQVESFQSLDKERADLFEKSGKSEKATGDAASKILEQIVDKLGTTAQSPQIAKKIEEVTKLLSDGVQKGETDQAVQIFSELIKQMSSSDSARGDLYRKAMDVLSSGASKLEEFQGKLDEITRRIDGIKSQQGVYNH